MTRTLALAALLAAPAGAQEDLRAFAEGALSGAAPAVGAGLRAFRAARQARAEAPKPARPEVELWVYNAEGGLVPWSERVLNASTELDHAVNAPEGARILKVKDSADLRKRLEEVRDSGARVKKLVLLAHGASGFTTLVDGSNLREFEGIDGAFAPGAKVELRSCSVASDEPGAAFAERLGATFLGSGGGTLTAAKGPYLGLPLVGGCPWGTCEVTVDAGGCSRVTSGYDLAAKRQGLVEALAALEKRAGALDAERSARLAPRLAESKAALAAEPWSMTAALKAQERVEFLGRLLEFAERPAAARGTQTSGR